jgi:hypothetical protein
MFATPLTVWPAMRVKSGPGAGAEDGAGTRLCCGGGATGERAGSAPESDAVRMRAVSTSPATNPRRTNRTGSVIRLKEAITARWQQILCVVRI